jgi:uncharacterized protein (DUF4415 family)
MKRAITLISSKKISAKQIDAENPPWSEEMLGAPVVRRGRGLQKAPTKILTTIRLDADIVDFFRADGRGFQTRINEALRHFKDQGLITRCSGPAKNTGR